MIYKKYRKKPIEIEAIQLTETSIREVYVFVYGSKIIETTEAKYWEQYCDLVIKDGMNILTLEDGTDCRAKHVATINDWIIKGIEGEFYPCKPNIFQATYELVEQQ